MKIPPPSSLSLALFLVLLAGCSTADVSERAAEPEPEQVVPGEMVKIPAGEFTMGSDIDPAGEKKPHLAFPAHQVNLPDFWIDRYEVTNGQFLKFVTESDYTPEGDWRSLYMLGMEDFPVVNVILDDAKAYCQWAGRRLPAEEEWEKAARGAASLDYPWGNSWESARANTSEAGFLRPVEVGKMARDASPYGVRDMMGNVQEWTSSELKPYPGGPRDDAFRRGLYGVRGSSSALRANDPHTPMKLWFRSGFVPRSQYGIGFRCASSTQPQQ
ncbi:MAG: SUMF1/EgtB/PvdO family nonheme iron enzyme [Acidobacteria bacterium]|nr:SUMF1/EgtB/PvdO family nonheme iron enzyme [Acidobacteriota bacterium]